MSNKADILSEAEVDFLLTTEKAEPAPAPGPAGGEDQAVTMRGDLEQINLADIFQTLGMSKMEGVLRIRNPLEERQIYCRDGNLRVHVPGRVATRRLGQRLVQAGLVQAEDLRTALLEQRKDKKPIGQVLVAKGLVSQQAIDEIVSTQVAEDLFALFTWRHGTFEFWKGEPNAALKEVFSSCPEYEVNRLLLEVARRSDEWQVILAAIGSLDEIPQRLREPDPGTQLGDLHRELLAGIRGQESYRELADHTTHGLFEVARVARDLVQAGILTQVDEAKMVAVAEAHAEAGNTKRALVLLQTLRDRPGDRPLGILQQMAKALETAGERRLAGAVLLEAAQRHTDSAAALDLARSARALLPHDVGTLSFLRTVLVAHAPPDSAELEKCTLDLLDAMVEADLVPTALEIIEDARRTGTAQPAILMREVRARQKGRDLPGAIRVLEELAKLHDERGQGKLAIETYDTLLRLDRSRKDVQKLLANRRRTRLGRIVRIVAAAMILLMVAGMGIVFWQQQEFTAAVAQADAEITKLLDSGDRFTARSRLEFWTEHLGNCEAIDDLQSRIAFAEATESGRQQKLLRTRINTQLELAAGHLSEGDLVAALAVYQPLAGEAKLRDEITGVVRTRVDALLAELALAAKALQGRMPPSPSTLIERRDLVTGQADLQAICRPALIKSFGQLEEMVRISQFPAFFSSDQQERTNQLVVEGRRLFARAKEMTAGYAAAIARNDQQRELDPLFKAAVASEQAFDFASALTHYRELERQPANEGEMRTHFRDRVARNATIVRLLEALHSATAAGDFATAQQQLRALRLSFPDVPFDRIGQLPLRIESRPTGAKVLCDGKEAGVTPLLVSRRPADSMRVAVVAEGFRTVQTVVTGEEPGSYVAHLTLPPTRSWQQGHTLETAPLRTPAATLFVDRAGNVTARGDDGVTRWTFRSGDLSGLLTPPCMFGGEVFVGSLDGDLRALDATTGELRWSLADMPTEVAPQLADRLLLVATSDRRLHGVDVVNRERFTLSLPETPTAILHAGGPLAHVLGERGRLVAVDLARHSIRWQRELPARSAPSACMVQQTLVVVDDQGQVVGVDSASGDVRWQRQLQGEVLGAPVAAEPDVWITTRTHLHRLEMATGQTRAVVAAEEHEWSGPAKAFGERLVVPLRSGMQVCELASGAPIYRLAATRRATLHVVGNELWIGDADHTVHAFDRLR